MALKASQIPPRDSREVAIVDWATDAIREGEAFLQGQNGYESTSKIIDAIMGEAREDLLRPTAISQLQLNHFGKIALDLAAAMTDVKPFWTFKTSNKKFEQQAQIGQNLSKRWWLQRMIDLRFCDVIKYALAGGSSYAHQVWNPEIQDMDVMAEDPRDVLPIRPSDLISVQNCFGVAIRRERTVNWLKAKYPAKQNMIRADREGSFAALSKNTRASRILEALGMKSGFVQNLYSSMGGKTAASNLNVPVADVFTIYVKDDSQNLTGEPQVMGDPATDWSYLAYPGQALYPRKRCIVLTRSCILYDGPSIYWHGMFPCPKLTLDPWPWSWLGKSPLKDLLPIVTEINSTARGIADKFQKAWRPDVIGDKNSVSRALMERLDTRRAGLKLRTNPTAGKGLEMVQPDLQSIVMGMQWLNFLIQEGKDLSGTQELTSLAQLGQIPATETIEKMQEAMNPAVRLRSRVMEAFMREFAMMTLMNFFQFYSKEQRVATLGEQNGLTFEDFDSDAGNMIPDDRGNPLPRGERALAFLKNFEYEVTPGSLLNASEVTDKLMYLQLARMGYVDVITLLEKLGVPNVGAPDSAGQTIASRLAWQSQQGIGMQVGAAGASAAGRKSSGQSMPRMVVKES